VKLEQYVLNARYENWQAAGTDCAWPRMVDADGWLAGGVAMPVHERRTDEPTPDWILCGIVPVAAEEVVITLTDGVPHRIATKEAGDGANRFYAYHLAGVGADARIVRLQLHDANGGELRVY
jgi:hypothetical protein